MTDRHAKTDAARQKVTIYDVADAAGVTISTVSRAFSRPELIGAKTRNRVIAVADKLNYRPSALAGSLTTKRTLLIGLVTADIRNPTVANIARGVQDTIRPRRYLPIVCSTGADPDLEISMLKELFQRGIDGLIVTSSYGWMASEVLRYFHTQADPDLPIVFIGRPIGMPDIDSVRPDAEHGARMAVEHLISLGHNRIACLCGNIAQGVTPRRWQSFLDTMAAHDLPVHADWVAEGETTFEGGAQAMQQVLASGPPPTAVFAINDLMAFGAMDTCRKNGLNIPNDISFIGFDDMPAASMSSPQLSTVAQPSYEMGAAAAQLLLNRIDDGSIAPQSREMTCTLMPRETSVAPRKG